MRNVAVRESGSIDERAIVFQPVRSTWSATSLPGSSTGAICAVSFSARRLSVWSANRIGPKARSSRASTMPPETCQSRNQNRIVPPRCVPARSPKPGRIEVSRGDGSTGPEWLTRATPPYGQPQGTLSEGTTVTRLSSRAGPKAVYWRRHYEQPAVRGDARTDAATTHGAVAVVAEVTADAEAEADKALVQRLGVLLQPAGPTRSF